MTDTRDIITEARRHVEKALLERAATDAQFRALLKANPHAAIREAFGSDPVPSLKITVIEEGAGEAVLVLPRAVADDELSDDILDLASGGVGFSSFLPPHLWEGNNGPRGPHCKK